MLQGRAGGASRRVEPGFDFRSTKLRFSVASLLSHAASLPLLSGGITVFPLVRAAEILPLRTVPKSQLTSPARFLSKFRQNLSRRTSITHASLSASLSIMHGD